MKPPGSALGSMLCGALLQLGFLFLTQEKLAQVSKGALKYLNVGIGTLLKTRFALFPYLGIHRKCLCAFLRRCK